MYQFQAAPRQPSLAQQQPEPRRHTLENAPVSAAHMASYPQHSQGQHPPPAHERLTLYGARPSPFQSAHYEMKGTVAYPYLPESKLPPYSGRGPVQPPVSLVYPPEPLRAAHAERQNSSDTAFSGSSCAQPQRHAWNASHPLPMRQLSSSGPLSPAASTPLSSSLTYTGHIKTSADAILLLAACDLPSDASVSGPSGTKVASTSASPPPRRIHRRLLEAERADLVKSGSVFVWDEDEAGMRRWTDGRCWSASRVSGCFLTYRELEARKRSANDPTGPRTNQYKVDGLIKQSFSMVTTSGRKVHIVSYYTKRDLREGRLGRVSEDPRFVGEAGGEWGLHIDEDEYPDPVTAVDGIPGNDEDSSGTPARLVNGSGHDTNTFASGRSPFQPAVGELQSSSVFALAPASASVAVTPPTKLKRANEEADGLTPSTLCAVRPPLKRLRSSSTGELKRLRAIRHADVSATLLTESNMLNAGFETAHEQDQRQYEQLQYTHTRRRLSGGDLARDMAPSALQAECDGSAAAGALLSLRSNGPSSTYGRNLVATRPSFLDTVNAGQSSMSSGTASAPQSNGSLLRLHSTRSYLDSCNESGSGGTPLTTPEDRSPPLKTCAKDTAPSSLLRRRSDGATPAGERSDSDKDTLSRLGVRV